MGRDSTYLIDTSKLRLVVEDFLELKVGAIWNG